MPGYDINRFVDMSSNEKNELTCAICQDILLDAVVTSCCLQSFCSDCINEWLQTNSVCPYDRKALTCDQLSRAPRALTNLLGKLKIRCDYLENGCQQVIDLENLSNHSQQCQHNPNKECERCFCKKSCHDCVEYLRDTNTKIAIELNQSKITNQEITTELNQLKITKLELLEMNAKLLAAYNRIYDSVEDKRVATAANNNNASDVNKNLHIKPSMTSNTTTGRFFKTEIVVKKVDMSAEMRDDAIHTARQALLKHNIKTEKIAMSSYIKAEFDRKYGAYWQCIIGEGCVCNVSYADKHYIFFAYGSTFVVLFKAPK